jgi:hypothetical protein
MMVRVELELSRVLCHLVSFGISTAAGHGWIIIGCTALSRTYTAACACLHTWYMDGVEYNGCADIANGTFGCVVSRRCQSYDGNLPDGRRVRYCGETSGECP